MHIDEKICFTILVDFLNSFQGKIMDKKCALSLHFPVQKDGALSRPVVEEVKCFKVTNLNDSGSR